MCGICGVLNLDDKSGISEELLTSMHDTMMHRGPDDAGLYLSPKGKVGLGHRVVKLKYPGVPLPLRLLSQLKGAIVGVGG